MAETLHGYVKWFNDAKGFGFIEHTTGRDVFVHYSVIEADGFKTLKDGEEVAYELKEGEKGLHAARVVRVNAPKKDENAGDTQDGVNQSNIEKSSTDQTATVTIVTKDDHFTGEHTPSDEASENKSNDGDETTIISNDSSFNVSSTSNSLDAMVKVEDALQGFDSNKPSTISEPQSTTHSIVGQIKS